MIAIVVSAHQAVVRIPAVHSPNLPHGIRYGRGTSGWLYLSLITDGKIRRYTIVTMEMTTPSVALKYFAVLPLVSVRVRTRTMVETTPETRFTTIGVPRRLEKYPNARGAAPSYPATACARSDPISQVTAEESNPMITPIAAMSARTLPAPVSTAPEPVRCPP